MNTIATFKQAVIDNGGEGRVIGLIFNNAYTKVFSTEEDFSFAENLVEDKEYIKFIEKDTKGVPYMVLKPLEYIEAILFALNDSDITKLDRRYMRG